MPVNNLITVRKGTSSQWSAANPVLASGELGYDLTNSDLKVGDGVTAWSDLISQRIPADASVTSSKIASNQSFNLTSLTTVGSITSNAFQVKDNFITYFAINPLGRITTGQWNGTPIDINYGGTNASTAAQALINLGAASNTHTHGNISNSGTIGSTSGLLVTTTTNGVLTTSSGISSSYITNFDSSVSGLISGIYAPLTGALNQFGSTTSSQLSSVISDETGSGSLVFNTSPAFSGTPTVPTASSGTNTNQIASTSFVRTEISNLVASAPSTLDTLNELATALGNDANFSTTVANSLSQKANLSGANFSGVVTAPSGDFVVLKQNGTVVSVDGHFHTTSDITNFDSSVSGLLPVKNIVGGTSVNISSVSGEYTVSVTGVAASSASSLITSCHNLTGSTISKMSAVYINGGHGNEPTITLALASGEATSSKTFGLTMEDISDNHSGDVVVVGSLIDVNTSQFGVVEGTTLYLSPTVPGAITTTKPSAPYHLVSLGKIVRNHATQGVIQVSIQNGFELEELHNVAVSGVSNGQFLQYNSGSGLWIPTSSGNFSTLLINGTGVSINGHSHTSSDITNFNNSVSGLLPSVSGSEYVTSTFSNNTYSISITGLQPSGNYSLVGHTHTSSNITDFNTAAGAAAPVQSVAGRTGTISLTKTDVGLGNVDNTSDSSKPVSTAQALADSAVQSYSIQRGNHTGSQLSSTISDFNSSVSGLLPITNILGGSNITVSQSGTIYTVAVTGSLGLTTEEVDDRVSSLLVAGTGIGLSYDDNANSLTIAVSGLSSTSQIGNGISGVITYNLSDPLNIVGSGSTTIDYNNISKTVTIGSPSLIREYELINSTKSSFTVTGGYALNNLDVYHNGIKLLASGDYSATNGTSFTLVQPAVSGDVVEWLGYSVVPRHQLILGEVRSDTVGNINYLGRAVAGSSESSNVWTIKRYTIATNGIDISTATASNTSWTNRLSASYI